jgi:hypothetical protein
MHSNGLLSALNACAHPSKFIRFSDDGSFAYVGEKRVDISPVIVSTPENLPNDKPYWIEPGKQQHIGYKIHVPLEPEQLHEGIVYLSTQLRERKLGHKIAIDDSLLDSIDKQFGKIITIYPSVLSSRENGESLESFYQRVQNRYHEAYAVLLDAARQGFKTTYAFSEQHDIAQDYVLSETNGLGRYICAEYFDSYRGEVTIPYRERTKVMRIFAGQGPLDKYVEPAVPR